MNWNTIYISGTPGFEKELQRKLERSDLALMNGSSGLPSGTCLYWMDDRLPLRQLKKEIGADLIWKYRLRFSGSVEETKGGSHSFTDWEQQMIGKMEAKSKTFTQREPIL
jgi:hypothetical protein